MNQPTNFAVAGAVRRPACWISLAILLVPANATAAPFLELTSMAVLAGVFILFGFAMAALAYALNEALRNKHRHGHHRHDAHRSFYSRHRRRVILAIWVLAWILALLLVYLAYKYL